MTTPQPTRKRLQKPTKPYPSFPLTPHNNGQWCKKIRGRVHFFGTWEDSDAALQCYLSQAADLHAGREARLSTVPADGVTVKQVVNHYLTFQVRRAESNEIGFQWFENCRTVLESFTQFVGGGRLMSDLRPDDFQRYRQKLAKQGLSGRGELGVHALNRAVTVVRGMLKYAYEVDLLKFPVKLGKAFARPSATLKRKSQQAYELANGKRLFSASDITKMIHAANEPLRAMILLGINGGFGNIDCARLPISAVDWEHAVIRFARPKTGVERVVPIWSETMAALRRAIDTRPEPAEKTYSGLLFLARDGKPLIRENVLRTEEGNVKGLAIGNSVRNGFGALLTKLGLKRKGVGFYALRHTFRTWADEVCDQHAIHRIMGHTIPGMSGIYIEEISLDRLRAVVNHVRSKLFGTAETSQPAAPTAASAT